MAVVFAAQSRLIWKTAVLADGGLPPRDATLPVWLYFNGVSAEEFQIVKRPRAWAKTGLALAVIVAAPVMSVTVPVELMEYIFESLV